MKFKILFCLFLSVFLSACELHKITNKQQLCRQAKREEIINQTNSNNISLNNINTSQEKKLKTTIEENC